MTAGYSRHVGQASDMESAIRYTLPSLESTANIEV